MTNPNTSFPVDDLAWFPPSNARPQTTTTSRSIKMSAWPTTCNEQNMNNTKANQVIGEI